MGGNSLHLWYGKLLSRIGKYYTRRGEKFIEKGRETILSNPKCQFVSPFALMINFTVSTTSKYQLIIPGDYKAQYKEHTDKETEDDPIGPQEMFILIKSHQENWFLKR